MNLILLLLSVGICQLINSISSTTTGNVKAGHNHHNLRHTRSIVTSLGDPCHLKKLEGRRCHVPHHYVPGKFFGVRNPSQPNVHHHHHHNHAHAQIKGKAKTFAHGKSKSVGGRRVIAHGHKGHKSTHHTRGRGGGRRGGGHRGGGHRG